MIRMLDLVCHMDFVIWICDSFEFVLKYFQVALIRKHRTTEVITDTQLWFHPEDFEKKIAAL